MLKPSILAASLLLLAGACDNEPGAGEATATVAEPAKVPEVTEAPLTESATYTFSQDGSAVKFVGAKVTGKHDGQFKVFSGAVDVVEGSPEKSTVTVEIDSASLEADDPKLTNHLKSPDFFDIEKFPKVRFVSTKIESGGTDGASHTVTGNLELHGVTKAVTFPATLKVADEGVEAQAKFVINRQDFGLVYPGMPDNLIKDDVLIDLEISADKK